ncbi:MAG TPA: MogA/MoaB family molybdenum cofactor biosynthesis protein [Thermomicrobiales bacterium]|jgi:molybdenum cofactor biosynthesis protein B
MSETPAEVSPSVQHREAAPDVVRCAVLTVSDTRTEETDTSGALIRQVLTDAGHVIADYRIVKDEPFEIRDRLAAWTSHDGVDAVLTNGGTGIANRDTTYDVIAGLLDKRLDGFGELFRMLSFAEIGAAAMLSRAVAGVYRGRVIVAMPGSTNAVRLAMERLVVPELAHMVYELRK